MDKAFGRRLSAIKKRKRSNLNYRFHDPNPPEVTADFLVKLFVEVNMPKAEAAIHAAIEERAAARTNDKPKASVVAKLKVTQAETEEPTPKPKKKIKSRTTER